MKLSSNFAENKSMAPLTVKVAESPDELARCRAVLDVEHALGTGHPAGKQLWQWVCRSGERDPVAVVIWAASAWHLKKRDEWIGWDAMKRSKRLGLIVNNTRLLILEKSREPNLATQVLGAALRVLCGQWEQVHGYRPLLAEAFTDIETHHGTSYKASNWIGPRSSGFIRCTAMPKCGCVPPNCLPSIPPAKSRLRFALR